MRKNGWVVLAGISSLLVGSMTVKAGSESTSDVHHQISQERVVPAQSPPLATDTGRYLSHEEIAKMGGVGNYLTPTEAKNYDKRVAEQDSLRRQVASAQSEGKSISKPTAKAGPREGVVFFKTAKADLTPDGKQAVARISNELKSDTNLAAQVNGYTDDVGTVAYNQKLSKDRAETVKNELMNQGVQSDQVKIRSFGEEQPIASNDTNSGRAVNRRAEIYVEPSGKAFG